MFEAARMLYLYVESPLHAGAGRSLGGLDLPIQRERSTEYPLVHAGGLKGALRAQLGLTASELTVVFGPETDRADDHAGALAPHDARLLLFPVRSLAGVFAWTTSVDILQRFRRALSWTGVTPPWTPPPGVKAREALVGEASQILCDGKLVLEEFTFAPAASQVVDDLAKWLGEEAFPLDDAYEYWQGQLPGKLCILPDDDLRLFTTLSTEVATRVHLDPATKTVAQGPWTEEYLPVDTLLYSPLLATQARDGSALAAAEVMNKVEKAVERQKRLQLGGDETIGRGLVHLRLGQGGGV